MVYRTKLSLLDSEWGGYTKQSGLTFTQINRLRKQLNSSNLNHTVQDTASQ